MHAFPTHLSTVCNKYNVERLEWTQLKIWETSKIRKQGIY